MKVWIALGLVFALLFSGTCSTLAVDHMVTPEEECKYSHTDSVTVTLSISAGGTATCSGKVTPANSSYVCSITVTLKKKTASGGWTTVGGPWKDTGSGLQGAGLKKTKSGLAAGTYKLFLTGKVKDADGNTLENVRKNSSERTYAG